MALPADSVETASFLLLGGAAVAEYAATRSGIDGLLSADAPAPAVRAICHSAITLIVCLAAILHHPPLIDLAVGLPFSASVSALTLALGVVLFVAPRSVGSTKAISGNKLWAFLLPTALLTLMIGFSGELSPGRAALLAIEGCAIFLAREKSRPPGGASYPPADVANSSGGALYLRAVVAVLLAILAAFGMVEGATGLALHSPAFRPGVAAVIAVGPAIVLPMIPSLATLAERGKRDQAITTIVIFSLVNLCLVLPVIVCVQHTILRGENLPFPMLVWRLDTVLLSTLGLLLIPMAAGRWSLGRAEGIALLTLYVGYLFCTLVISHA